MSSISCHYWRCWPVGCWVRASRGIGHPESVLRAEDLDGERAAKREVVVDHGNDALRRKLSKGGKIKRTGEVELQSVTGEKLAGEYTIVRELTVGGVTLKDMPVVFADSHAFKRLGLDGQPALLLGMNALRSFDRVSIDFARKKLKVVLPEESMFTTTAVAMR